VNPLDGRREAPDSKRMESAAMAWREASTPSLKSPAAKKRQLLTDGDTLESTTIKKRRLTAVWCIFMFGAFIFNMLIL